jgi:cytochrome oxidase Cu insertion factor (SCO1/SenC/PrrC family)
MNKNYKILCFWLFVVFGGVSIGISIMYRDINNGFGTITYGKLPPFILTDTDGKVVRIDNTSNKIRIANFISFNYSHNPKVLLHLQSINSIVEQFKDESRVEFVSFFIKSDNTDQNYLSNTYKKKNPHWKFFSRNKDQINEIAKICIKKYLIHSGWDKQLTLVDQNNIIRGYYQTDNSKSLEKLVKDINKLI